MAASARWPFEVAGLVLSQDESACNSRDIPCFTTQQPVRVAAPISRSTLGGADFRGAILEDARLDNAVLTRADLTGADLRGADLSGSNMADTDLIVGRLQGADLSRAALTGADVSDADVNRANLDGAELTGGTWAGAQTAAIAVFHARGAAHQLTGTMLERTADDIGRADYAGQVGPAIERLRSTGVDITAPGTDYTSRLSPGRDWTRRLKECLTRPLGTEPVRLGCSSHWARMTP